MKSRVNKKEQSLALARHRRKCVVCHHPDRDAIEDEFIHWRSPYEIARQYHISDYRSLYRHARSTGIADLRRHNFHSALDSLVEAAEEAKVTGDCVIRAIRAYSCVDANGRWTELPTQVRFTTVHDSQPTAPQRPAAPSTRRSTVIDLVEPEPKSKTVPELQSDPDSESEIESDSGSNSESETNSQNGFALDPALEAELLRKLNSPLPADPAARDINLIYRRAIRTGLNALKT